MITSVSRRRVVLAVGIGLATSLGAHLLGLDWSISDVKYDWVVAKAALFSDAHADVLKLAQEFEVELHVVFRDAGQSIVHPRTPGAILLSIPLLLIPFDLLFALTLGVSFALTWILAEPSISSMATWQARVAASIFVGVSLPVVATLWFSSQSALVAVLVLYGWVALVGNRTMLGGILLGAAIVLKVFPAILLLPLLIQRRWPALQSVIVSVLALNLFGLLLPGVSLAGSVQALSGASQTWALFASNASAYGPLRIVGLSHSTTLVTLLLAAGLGIGYLALRRRAQAATDPLPWLLLALLFLPISWGSYDVVLLPVALAVFASTTPKVKPHALFMLACWVLPLFFFPYGKNGIFIFFSRLTISAMWLNGMLRVSEAATYLPRSALAWEIPPKRADSHHQD